MSKVLKWILYVVLGLVVLAVVAGIVFAIFGGVGHGYYMMRPGFRMMEPYHYSLLQSGRMIFGGLLGLGFLILIIVGIVALVNVIMRGNRPAQVTQTAQPASNQPSRCSQLLKWLHQPAPVPTAANPLRMIGRPALTVGTH